MSIEELLSLVELTKEHVIELLPPRKTPIKKASVDPVKIAIPLQVKPSPPSLELQKKAPVAKQPLEVKQSTKHEQRDIKDILDLLKIHCPLLKLTPPPSKKVLVLFDQEPKEEKQILINLANALKKEGYEVEMTSISEFDQTGRFCLLIAERALLSAHPHLKEQLFTIPSIAELIAKPHLRRELWNQILETLIRNT